MVAAAAGGRAARVLALLAVLAAAQAFMLRRLLFSGDDPAGPPMPLPIWLDEAAAGGLVAVLDGPGEHNLAFRAEQWFLRQAVEVAGNTFFFVHGGRIDLHRLFGLDREK